MKNIFTFILVFLSSLVAMQGGEHVLILSVVNATFVTCIIADQRKRETGKY